MHAAPLRGSQCSDQGTVMYDFPNSIESGPLLQKCQLRPRADQGLNLGSKFFGEYAKHTFPHRLQQRQGTQVFKSIRTLGRFIYEGEVRIFPLLRDENWKLCPPLLQLGINENSNRSGIGFPASTWKATPSNSFG